jgi:hypothetical protein
VAIDAVGGNLLSDFAKHATLIHPVTTETSRRIVRNWALRHCEHHGKSSKPFEAKPENSGFVREE